jgi:hypothetical protein
VILCECCESSARDKVYYTNSTKSGYQDSRVVSIHLNDGLTLGATYGRSVGLGHLVGSL